jgi:hypothetical protein
MVRYICVTHFDLDLFDIASNTYESLIFYSGLGGFRFIVNELLDTLSLKMDANPGGGAANPNPDTVPNNNQPYSVLAVPDPTGVADGPFNPDKSSQPYASYLADHLDGIRKLNGGGQSPALTSFATARDKA